MQWYRDAGTAGQNRWMTPQYNVGEPGTSVEEQLEEGYWESTPSLYCTI
ncbi:hypothetical protein J2S00_001238 [Caldalkalibacillus uzonensis]|uniref:Uncharacterized protein n=1 Tax=Caldalkalibacillus uzonensis TaxID=353224 RepID=A0ABU0CPW3_9BACI|nr:hypothetical protein [Caldalkalibacillus uzonensis]MDQ0338454.1 hypothetical protein [Caldalkalibacillus uzonensis]